MNIPITIALLLLVGIVAIWIRYRYFHKKRKNNDEEASAHKVYSDFLEKYAKKINLAAKQSLSSPKKYISWTDRQHELTAIKAAVPMMSIPKGYRSKDDLHHQYRALRNYIVKAEPLRVAHNKAFVEREASRCEQYFRKILTTPLDEQQIDAILHDDDNTLIIAGAGCGKTTTVHAKVKYILDNRLATASEILLLSFAKKSADDLKIKLGYLGVACKTFHALSYQILSKTERRPDVLAPDEAEQMIIDSHCELLKNTSYLASFNDLILNGLRPIKNENEFESYKDYIEYLRDSEFESLKGIVLKKKFSQGTNKKTLNSEFIKSAEECYIANLLFLNGVEYCYESPYLYQQEIDEDERFDKHKKRYRPDFTIFLNGYNQYSIRDCPNPQDNIVYLEHYGIDAHGNTPKFFEGNGELSASAYYKSIMDWKEEIHRSYGTVLIKSYSYEFKYKTIEENLIHNLIKQGVVLRPKTNEEIYHLLEEAYSKELDAVMKLVTTFISLLKSNNRTFKEIYQTNKKTFKQDRDILVRNEQFLNVIASIYKIYESRLRKNAKHDFNDLINKSIDKVNGNQFLHHYKYIVIDEFQDISINRYQLLHALKKQSYFKLFAVGDDWQSIYRFTGSDLTLFKRFEAYFGYTIAKKIETTYRFANPLIDISSNFILKNPNQTKKSLRSTTSKQTEVLFDFSKSDEKSLNEILRSILEDLFIAYGETLENKSITLIGRYNHDLDQLTSKDGILVVKDQAYIRMRTILKDIKIDEQGNTIRNNTLRLDKKIDFMTVHKAKGLESDIVILINCETGKYGFPAELSDDPILNLLLSGDDRYPNGEERRAFYVALTRAKEKFYFLANKSKLSKFVREVYAENVKQEEVTQRCAKCESELRYIKDVNSRYGVSQMFGCTSFKYGCDYTIFVSNSDLIASMAP
ncbi:UvrD-helicase domain-containing protein [Sphingobacterium sp. LRF_L2]|uniref:UvrD-helicase domain-containing protein n=1 Tax=Sphingobacterium sp. LRF_L2 TaxID=3369421 RepID=UPI003F622CE4